MLGNETVPDQTSCFMSFETNCVTDNISEAALRAAGENSKLGHAVGDLSCVNQPSLCLLSTTSKDFCFVLSALYHLLSFRSCPHTTPVPALPYYLIYHPFSFKPVNVFNVVQ